MKRSLRLSREVLSELTTDDLRAVNGAAAQTNGDLCVALSLDLTCGRPTCGRNCTGRSDPLTK
jgi:hypothetical protein